MSAYQNGAKLCTKMKRVAGQWAKLERAAWPFDRYYRADRLQYGRGCGV